MKKTILLLFAAVLFLQCSSEDTSPLGDINQSASFSLFVEGDFFIPASSGKLYISDSNGTLIREGELLNNQQTTLDVIIDPNMVYDASISLFFITNGAAYNLLYTYENINPGEYTLQALQGYNPNLDELTLNLTNTGEPLEIYTSTRPMTVSYDPINGGTNILNGRLAASPGNYYASVKKAGEPFPRYIWSEGLTGDTSSTLDFNSLPFVEGISTIELPNNESIYIGINGVKNDDPLGVDGVRHLIQEKDYLSATSNHDAIFPAGVFDALETSVQFKQANSDKEFSFMTKSEILPNTISNSALDFSVNDASFSNFSATTTGNYDCFNTAFVYTNAAQDVVVIYEIYGPSATQVTVSKVNLFNNIFADDPNISADLLPSARRFGVTNYSQFTSYAQYVGAPWLYGPKLSLNGFMEHVLELLN